jgi:hypothetical protein
MKKELKEEVIGAIVVVAVIIAGTLGAFMVLKPTGQAYQMPIEVCSCTLDGYWEQVAYRENYVFSPDGSSRYVGEIPDSSYKCAEVCANIGGHA